MFLSLISTYGEFIAVRLFNLRSKNLDPSLSWLVFWFVLNLLEFAPTTGFRTVRMVDLLLPPDLSTNLG